MFKVPIWYKLVLSFNSLWGTFCLKIHFVFLLFLFLFKYRQDRRKSQYFCWATMWLWQSILENALQGWKWSLHLTVSRCCLSQQASHCGWNWGRLTYCIHIRKLWMLRLHSLLPIRQSRAEAQGKKLPFRVNFLTGINLIKKR